MGKKHPRTCRECGEDLLFDNIVRSGYTCWTCRLLSGDTSVITRLIMAQRGISMDEIAARMKPAEGAKGPKRNGGLSREFVRRLITGSVINPGGRNLSPETIQRRLFEADHIITEITQERGGVYATTGSTTKGAIELGRMIQGKGAYTRIRNYDLETA